MIYFKSNEHINEKEDRPYRGFGYSILFSDPIDFAIWSQRDYCKLASFNSVVDKKTSLVKSKWGQN